MPVWDDLTAFLSEDDFAVPAVFAVAGADRTAISVLFDDPHFSAEAGEYTMEAGSPRIMCRTADVAGIKKRDTVRIGGETYSVAHDPHADGTGMSQVDLIMMAAP